MWEVHGVAADESVFADVFDCFGDIHNGKIFAIPKNFFFYYNLAAHNGYRFEIFTFHKGFTGDVVNRFRNKDFFEAVAFIKSGNSYFFERGWKIYFLEIFQFSESVITYEFDCFREGY